MYKIYFAQIDQARRCYDQIILLNLLLLLKIMEALGEFFRMSVVSVQLELGVQFANVKTWPSFYVLLVTTLKPIPHIVVIPYDSFFSWQNVLFHLFSKSAFL